MVSSIKRLVRWASVVRGGKDTGKYPVQQVIYLGKTADTVMVFPYGMHANVDQADLALMFAVSGDTDNRAAIATSMTRRSTLAAGDVEIYSPVSRSRVTIRASGAVEVECTDLTATASGAATVTAPAISLVGDVAITGNFSVSGTMTNAGKDVGATHGHTQGNDSGGSTEQPISGVT